MNMTILSKDNYSYNYKDTLFDGVQKIEVTSEKVGRFIKGTCLVSYLNLCTNEIGKIG